MAKLCKDKYVNKLTIGLAQAAKLHGCSQLEELKNRKLEAKFRAERLKQYWQEQNEETIKIMATGKRIPGPDYIITTNPKKQDQK